MFNNTTTRSETGYNATIWRFQGGKVLSVTAGTFEGGKILRTAGKWTTDNGLAAYHAAYLAEALSFGGEPCEVVVTRGTDGMKDAIRSFSAAWAKHAATEIVRYVARESAEAALYRENPSGTNVVEVGS